MLICMENLEYKGVCFFVSGLFSRSNRSASHAFMFKYHIICVEQMDGPILKCHERLRVDTKENLPLWKSVAAYNYVLL